MDEELLAEAERVEQRLIEAEHAAEVARADFHRAVRRLHLSHQRVHQIVEAAGGARRWGKRGGPPAELVCSFCGRPQRKTRKLVTGPGVYICEKCVELAETVIASQQATETALGPLQPVPAGAPRQRCSFCGKHRHQVTGLATTVENPAGKHAGDAAICIECLNLCREIHTEGLA